MPLLGRVIISSSLRDLSACRGNFQFVIVVQHDAPGRRDSIVTYHLLMSGCDAIVPRVTLDAEDAITSVD